MTDKDHNYVEWVTVKKSCSNNSKKFTYLKYLPEILARVTKMKNSSLEI